MTDEVFDAQLAGSPPPRKPTSIGGWFIISLFISMLLIPFLFAWIPGEVARWHQAAAIDRRLDGDLDGALRSLNRAMEQFPDRPNLLRTRAEWLRVTGDYQQALADCERALELAPEDFRAILLHSQILQHLERFDEAVQDGLKLLALSEERNSIDRGEILNMVAYSRALADSDLDLALDEIEKSMLLIEPLEGPQAAMIDTRGFIHYLRDDFVKAREDLDRAVELIEAHYSGLASQLKGEHVGVLDPRRDRHRLDRLGESVAVIRYHRSLALDALGQKEGAATDRERVKELGHEPSPALF
jgi:tetratricopeptide (TPR) repeat protein